MNSIIDLVHAVNVFVQKDVTSLIEETDNMLVLRSDSSEFLSGSSDVDTDVLIEIEGSAEDLLFTQEGLVNPVAQRFLQKHAMDVIKLPETWQPFHYGLKTKKFCIPISH